ncbi:MAG: hypothetical protein JNL57_08130 [Bacteroidetes bacterium]|nr:hypothetical protein [Bacteroidota bacterium]
MNPDKPIVFVKRNKLQDLFDYCLDSKIEFSVKERELGIDEFEVALEVVNIKKAVLLGMFLRENRMELAGAAAEPARTAVKKPAPARKTTETPAISNPLLSTDTVAVSSEQENTAPAAENPSLSFDLN